MCRERTGSAATMAATGMEVIAMPDASTLHDHLASSALPGEHGKALCLVIEAIAAATADISSLVALGSLAGSMGASIGRNIDGDTQKELDLQTQHMLMAALRAAPVAAIVSEELDGLVVLDASAPLAVAFDPLDGSSNIDTNMSIGTIFSIRPARGEQDAFAGPGHEQLAAGFVVYGPQTQLVLTTGTGVDMFTLDQRDQTYRLTRSQVRIPAGTAEFAINASNYRHWQEPVRVYIDDCLNGTEGPREKNFNMRWIGSLVAEAYRILARGGVFLYPADKRQGYENGRLRLLYEAHPMAFIMEQAGGGATNGHKRILDIGATSLHQRVPLIFGAAPKVARIERLHNSPDIRAELSPLFGRRGLFRV